MQAVTARVEVSDALKKLLDKTLKEIKQWKKDEEKVFVETPALKESRLKLDKNGCVILLGQSGDGKTSVGYCLLVKSGRQMVIIRGPSDWEEIDVEKEQIIMIDDVMGRHVLDKDAKVKWVKKLQNIYACVRSGKVQIVITSRTTVFSVCKEELQNYDIFHPNNIVHLSGSESQNKLDVVTKVEILRKYIHSHFAKPKIFIETEGKPVADDEHKISESMLKTIAEKETVLGFPQCCRMFVSSPACFARGHNFFDKPTEFLIQEINRMYMSRDDIDQFNYCTLVCVLLYRKLTVHTIEKEIETIKLIANSCRINVTTTPISAEIRDAAARLSTSYLIATCETSYAFQHNSLLETIFISFFKSQPKLLIEHCDFDLIQSLVTTEHAKEKSDLFCQIQGDTQTDSLCSRLATEIMRRHVRQAVAHRALTDPVFACKFCSYIQTSDKNILQSTQYNNTILYWAAGVSDTCFVGPLLTVMESAIPVATMEENMSTALEEACLHGNYGVYILFVSRTDVTVYDECLRYATGSGDVRIVRHLLSTRNWSTSNVTQALYMACMFGKYDLYTLLVTHDVAAIDDICLRKAADSGDVRIVAHLLSTRNWSTRIVTKALCVACRGGRYELYRLLVTHDNAAIDDQCMRFAAISTNIQIKDDLLSKGYTLPDV